MENKPSSSDQRRKLRDIILTDILEQANDMPVGVIIAVLEDLQKNFMTAFCNASVKDLEENLQKILLKKRY